MPECTEAERALIESALANADAIKFDFRRDDPTFFEKLNTVQQERIGTEAMAKIRAAYFANKESLEALRKATAQLSYGHWTRIEDGLSEEWEATLKERREAEAAAKAATYIRTGVFATPDEIATMRAAFSTPLIAPGGREPEHPSKTVHRFALLRGCPEIKGFYGCDFATGEFIRDPESVGEPDEFPR